MSRRVLRSALLALGIAPLALALGHAVGALSSERGAELARGLAAALVHADTVKTAAAVVAATLLAQILGLPLGVELGARRSRLAAVVLAPLALPPVFVGGVLSDVGGLGPAPSRGAGAELARWSGLTATWALSFAPLAALGARAALARVPAAEWHAARLMAPPSAPFRLVLWPRLRAPFALLAAAVATLAVTDVVTPPHFGVDTVASRAAFEFLTTLDHDAAYLASAPTWLVLVLAVAWLARPLTLAPPRRALPLHPNRATGSAAVGYAGVALALPASWALFATGGAGRVLDAAGRLGPELRATLAALALVTVAAAGAAAMRVALGAARAPAGPTAPRLAERLAIAAPLCAPGLVVGLVLASTPFHPSLDRMVFAGGLLLRTLPWALLVAFAAQAPPAARASAALGVPARRRARLALGGGTASLSALAALVAAAALLREVDLFAGFALAGSETLAVRAAQELHYGLRAEAAAPVLVQVALATAACVLLPRRAPMGPAR